MIRSPVENLDFIFTPFEKNIRYATGHNIMYLPFCNKIEIKNTLP